MGSENDKALDLVSAAGGRRERIIYKVVLTGGKHGVSPAVVALLDLERA